MPNYSFMKIKVYVVPEDVPWLLGLDVLDKEKFAENTVQKGLLATNHGCPMPLTPRQSNRCFSRIAKIILFTKSEIVDLHVISSNSRLENCIKYEVRKGTTPNQVDEPCRQLMKTISKACETRQTFNAPPQPFRALLPPSVFFISCEVALEVM